MAESLVIVFFSDGRYHPTAINEAERGKEIKKRQRETRKLTSYGMGKKKILCRRGSSHLEETAAFFCFRKRKEKRTTPTAMFF